MKNISSTILWTGFLLLHSFSLLAQDTPLEQSLGTTLSNDAKQFFSHAGMIFTSPLHWQEKDFLTAHFIMGGTITSFALDDPIRRFALHNQSKFRNDVFSISREYGREIYGLSLGGALYLGGLVFKSKDVRVTGMMLVESIVFSGTITTVIKTLVGRSRPYTEEGILKFHGMEFNNDYTALPSGHATVAFAISSTLAARFKNTWASIGLYSLATLTAASRIYTDDHWFSDTFLGAAIGTTVGMSVVNLHENNNEESTFRIVPRSNGITIVLLLP
jgi:membrane-associated phospholipid phosphatase